MKRINYFNAFILLLIYLQRFLPTPMDLESLLGSEEEDSISGTCSGRRCSSNEHCCSNTVCVDLDGRKCNSSSLFLILLLFFFLYFSSHN